MAADFKPTSEALEAARRQLTALFDFYRVQWPEAEIIDFRTFSMAQENVCVAVLGDSLIEAMKVISKRPDESEMGFEVPDKEFSESDLIVRLGAVWDSFVEVLDFVRPEKDTVPRWSEMSDVGMKTSALVLSSILSSLGIGEHVRGLSAAFSEGAWK